MTVAMMTSSSWQPKGVTVVAKHERDPVDKVDDGLLQRLTALSHDHFRVNPGSLFPSLYRLEQDDKLKAEWRPSENNRNAKDYTLTASGRRQLDQHKRRWERTSFAISSV